MSHALMLRRRALLSRRGPSGPVVVNTGQGSTTATTSHSMTLPTTAADDLIVYGWILRDTATAPTFGGTYSGGAFTDELDDSASAPRAGWRWSRCTGNHSGQTLTISNASAGSIVASRMIVRGALASGSPIDVKAATRVTTAALGEDLALAGLTTTVDLALVALMAAVPDNLGVAAQTMGGAAMTEQIDGQSSGGNDCTVAFATLVKANAGATGAFAADIGNNAAGTVYVGAAFAIKPA